MKSNTNQHEKEKKDAYLQMLKESKELADAIINQRELTKSINQTK